jgi:hypothetical protein
MTKVGSKRLEKAKGLVNEKAAVLGKQGLFDLIDELGWFEAVSYDEWGRVQINLNDIQTVGLAAALVEATEKKDA